QVIGPTGDSMKVKVPFSASDLTSWREEVKNFRVDPRKAAKRFEWIVRNQDPDCNGIDLMLTELTESEKELVIKTVRTHVQGQIASGALHRNVDQHFPLVNPHWNPNDAGNYAMLARYMLLVQFELEHAIPRAFNWSALYNGKQGKKETPTEFLD
ncbi:hypothetical protein N310_03403, partial [Acanthisitta chloris]